MAAARLLGVLVACGGGTSHALDGVPRPLAARADEAMLGRAILHANAADPGWQRLFARLSSGLPISALALGSSVTGTTGGCTHSVVPWCEQCCGSRDYGSHARPGSGWLRIPFDWLNSTWPHRDHRLYNAGKPATPIGAYAECMRAWMPTPVDLWILEVGAVPNKPADLERIVRVARSLPGTDGTGPPAILLVVLADWCLDNGHKHVRGCPLPKQRQSDDLLTVRNGFLAQGRGHTSIEDLVALLSRYYGLRAVSLHDAWWPGLWRLTSPGGGATGTWLAELTADGIHPAPAGIEMLGDVVRDALWQAYRQSRWHAPTPRPSPSTAAAQPHETTAHAQGAARLPPPLYPSANLRARASMVCYGFDANLGERARGRRGRVSRSVLHAISAEGGTLVAQLLPSTGGAPAGAARAPAAAPGWQFIEYEKGSRTQLKPGLRAETPGAVARIQLLPVTRRAFTAYSASREAHNGTAALSPVSSSLLGGADPSGAQLRRPYVLVRYLKSYEGMGIARATCEGACACAPAEMDGHLSQKYSVVGTEALRDVRLDASALRTGAPCVLRVEVLQRSSSPTRGHRCKLVQIVVGDEDDEAHRQ